MKDHVRCIRHGKQKSFWLHKEACLKYQLDNKCPLKCPHKIDLKAMLNQAANELH